MATQTFITETGDYVPAPGIWISMEWGYDWMKMSATCDGRDVLCTLADCPTCQMFGHHTLEAHSLGDAVRFGWIVPA